MDGHDTLALMPTGGGKSLCYQVPAMAMDGLCLVISPLIALMKDQVENLRSRQITAYSLFSGMSRREVEKTLRTAAASNCRFLYVSPERLETTLFKEYLPALDIRLIAVDEAHCISQWGYDFRPPYLRIAALRSELTGVPVLALTASATPDVQQDICDRLEFHDPRIFRQSFERPNLSYSVFRVDAKITRIREILQKVPGSGIVYCKSRRRTREISDLLRLHGISADHYHAGLSPDERSQKQEAWLKNEIRIMACTNAFGMGIDKPDVRTVIHADVPDCLENYYQEAGRAGRDGKKSYAVLLYDENDLKELQELAALRFPSLDEIRSTYQSVANYLQLASGSGEGQYFDFDLPRFTKQFGLNPFTALYALKALEQEGWLSFNEQVFLPASAQFVTGKDSLYEFEKAHPEYEPLVKCLLRSYEGIYDQPVPVSEKQLAWLLKQPVEQVSDQMRRLHQWGILRWQPQKESPQVYWPRPRVRAEELTVDITAINKRKEKFLARMRQMGRYVQEETECRSRMIAHYFGDDSHGDCGICDICLRRKRTGISREEWEKTEQQLADLLRDRSLGIRELLQQVQGVSPEKVSRIIEFLQAEQKLESDAAGNIRLK